MRKSLKITLIVVLPVAFLALAGALLYWYFIGSRIKDGGRMENPDVYRAGKELVEFSWQLTWVQWFELQNMLVESELPEYQKLYPDAWDETNSEICIEKWLGVPIVRNAERQ